MHRNLCTLRANAYAESQPILVTAGKTYRFQTWVKQQLGGGSALHRLAFYNSSNVLIKRVNLSGSARQLPTAWSISSGWEKFSGLVAAPTGSSYVLLEVAADHIDGYVYFDDVTLDEFVPEATITRSAYGLAGQLIATRVSGDPVSGNNGLYYFLADHLGSVSGMTNDSGNLVGDIIRFEPFGEYRPGSGPSEITDRGFTGHRHNDELGLVYMNARYYVGSIGRFASADTIIPEPGNPQAFNRFSYVLNQPLKLTDPSGHNYCVDPNEPCNSTNPSSPPYTPPYTPPPTPIWTRSFVDDPDAMQYYGQTKFAEGKYSNSGGVHTGLDYTMFGSSLGGRPDLATEDPDDWEYSRYGSGEFPLIPVYAGCYCTVKSVGDGGTSYDPGLVILTSNNEEHAGLQLYYGHLGNIQVTAETGTVTPDTILGYIETTEFHVHVEIRGSDNRYINPFPYLSEELQVEALSYQGWAYESTTTYREGAPQNPARQPDGYYLQ